MTALAMYALAAVLIAIVISTQPTAREAAIVKSCKAAMEQISIRAGVDVLEAFTEVASLDIQDIQDVPDAFLAFHDWLDTLTFGEQHAVWMGLQRACDPDRELYGQ